MAAHPPFVVTLCLDKTSFAFFDELRKKYFPSDKNFLAAHLTLFHHLPPSGPAIEEDLAVWSRQTAPLLLQVPEVKNIGKGVAYKIESAALLRLHKNMQAKWNGWLTPQDKQKLWPHITVQNKVSVAEAKETWHVLQASFQPFTATGLGFDLWSYEGGPWKALQSFAFNQK